MDAGAGGRRDGRLLGHGDLRRRHPGDAAAHARHAGLGRLYGRGLRDDAQGPGGARRSAPTSLFSALGGLFGTAVLILAAPYLAEVALKFSSFEYFWMALLGLTCAAFIGSGAPLKGCRQPAHRAVRRRRSASNNPAGVPRFTFGMHRPARRRRLHRRHDRPVRGVRGAAQRRRAGVPTSDGAADDDRQPVHRLGAHGRRYWRQQLRGNVIGVAHRRAAGRRRRHRRLGRLRRQQAVVAHPGEIRHRPCRGDHRDRPPPTIARWAAPGCRRWSSAFPATSITAIVIGVLYVKGMNPGPTLFFQPAEHLRGLHHLHPGEPAS